MLSEKAEQINLGELMLFGKGEDKSGESIKLQFWEMRLKHLLQQYSVSALK